MKADPWGPRVAVAAVGCRARRAARGEGAASDSPSLGKGRVPSRAVTCCCNTEWQRIKSHWGHRPRAAGPGAPGAILREPYPPPRDPRERVPKARTAAGSAEPAPPPADTRQLPGDTALPSAPGPPSPTSVLPPLGGRASGAALQLGWTRRGPAHPPPLRLRPAPRSPGTAAAAGASSRPGAAAPAAAGPAQSGSGSAQPPRRAPPAAAAAAAPPARPQPPQPPRASRARPR